MGDIIVIVIIAAAIAGGTVYTVRHFKGKGGCCGGSDHKPKRKKLPRVIGKKTFRIDGMKCANCKNRVESIVNDISGISGKADLKAGTLTVFYSETVDDEIIKARVERAGYKLSYLSVFRT